MYILLFFLIAIAIILIMVIIYLCFRKNRTDEKSDDALAYEPIIEQELTRTFKCFIAGSTSLQLERDAIRAVISEIHNRWVSKNVYITSYTFEDFDNRVHAGGLQNVYNDFISREADCSIFIVDGEIGSKTLQEFSVSLNSFKKRNRPSIYVYNCERGVWHPQSEAFIKKVKSEGHYWRPYADLAELKLKFKEDLTNELIGKFV